MKVSGDVDTIAALPEDVDIDAMSTDTAALCERVLSIGDGEPCCAERHGLTQFAITCIGPSI